MGPSSDRNIEMSSGTAALQVENEQLRAEIERLRGALAQADRDRFLATILEKLYDGISVVDASGVVLYESPSVARITGRPPSAALGQSFFDYLHPDERDDIERRMEEHRAAPGEWRGAEVRFLHADGTYHRLESRAINLVDDEDIRGFVAIYRDVTENREATARLEEADRRLTEISSTVPGAIFQLRTPRDAHHFGIPFVSEGIRDFLGVSPEEGSDNPWLLFDRIHADDKLRFFEAVREAAEAGSGFSTEFRVVGANDNTLWMRCNAACRVADDDEVLFTGVVFDISTEKQAHQQMQQAWLELEVRVQDRTAKLRDANEKLRTEIEHRERAETELQQVEGKLDAYERIMTTGEMMTGVAHDLHQPLTAIANYAGGCLLRMERGTLEESDLRRIFGEMKDSALHAADVVRRMLIFTKSRRFQREALPINEICELAVRLARVGLNERVVALRTEYADDLPDVLADRIPVAQVVLNLLNNAAQALGDRPEGDRNVILRTSSYADGERVRISVYDNGPGLPKHQHEAIFERFMTSRDEGLGLGLAVCRTIVELHEGTIWVETPAVGGCALHFTLPVVR